MIPFFAAPPDFDRPAFPGSNVGPSPAAVITKRKRGFGYTFNLLTVIIYGKQPRPQKPALPTYFGQTNFLYFFRKKLAPLKPGSPKFLILSPKKTT